MAKDININYKVDIEPFRQGLIRMYWGMCLYVNRRPYRALLPTFSKSTQDEVLRPYLKMLLTQFIEARDLIPKDTIISAIPSFSKEVNNFLEEFNNFRYWDYADPKFPENTQTSGNNDIE